LLACLAIVIATGLLSRAYPTGWRLWDERVGDALYAVAVYLAVQVLVKIPPLWGWAVAAGLCGLVEAFKLTGLPAAWSEGGVRIARLVFGTTPSVENVVWYAIGAALAGAVHVAIDLAIGWRSGARATPAPMKNGKP
jgi:hypothetical protein